MTVPIDHALGRKLLSLIDAGLICGVGKPIPGQMCIEAAVCYALGEPHGDEPSCVGRAIRTYKIGLNDSEWSSNAARAKGLREIGLAQLGSDKLDQNELARRLAMATVNHLLPRVLRQAGIGEKFCVACETADTLSAASCAASVAASDAASDAARYAASDAARYAASDAASAANAASDAARYAASGAANAARYAARYAARAASAGCVASDAVLTFAARLGTQVLLDMGSPGCELLDLL